MRACIISYSVRALLLGVRWVVAGLAHCDLHRSAMWRHIRVINYLQYGCLFDANYFAAPSFGWVSATDTDSPVVAF